MAKNKSKKKQQQKPALSPYYYMREKARNLPIGKCYIAPPDWQESGMAHIIITRVRPNGNLVLCSFLVDTFCLGVKDANYHENITPEKVQDYLYKCKIGMGLEEISYNEAHNIIYGAIAFAEEGGIKPTKDFDPAGYILEEDTDDIPLIEYEFGKNGKHFLIVHPDRKDMPYFHILKKNLGNNFDFILPYGEEVDDEKYYNGDKNPSMPDLNPDIVNKVFENMSKWNEESNRHPDEIYSYQYPEYPQTLSVKNQFIANEILSANNYSALPRETINRILALPKDEAAQDISDIILYEIGKTYKGINDDTIESSDNSAIMHSLMLLAQLQSDKSLDAILELMHQTDKFVEYHLGDLASELIHPALYASGLNKIEAIEGYLNQPGLDSYQRAHASEALAMIIFNHPERREEIIAVFRRLLTSMLTRLPKQEACDGRFAGLLMSDLMDINATELIPEIEAVFATDCVDKTIAGDCESVIKDIKLGHGSINNDKYIIPDIFEQYDDYKKFLKKPN